MKYENENDFEIEIFFFVIFLLAVRYVKLFFFFILINYKKLD